MEKYRYFLYHQKQSDKAVARFTTYRKAIDFILRYLVIIERSTAKFLGFKLFDKKANLYIEIGIDGDIKYWRFDND